MVGREVLAQVTPSQAGGSGAGGQREHPHWFLCSVKKTNSVIRIDFCSQEENASSPPKRARAALRAERQHLFHLLGLVLSLVHNYGQLGCRFFPQPQCDMRN